MFIGTHSCEAYPFCHTQLTLGVKSVDGRMVECQYGHALWVDLKLDLSHDHDADGRMLL